MRGAPCVLGGGWGLGVLSRGLVGACCGINYVVPDTNFSYSVIMG
jgi:hypothetical protein